MAKADISLNQSPARHDDGIAWRRKTKDAARRSATGRLVAGDQVVAVAKSTDRLVDLAAAPGVGAQPAEVAHGIAEVGEFPVEYGSQSVGADDHIAIAEVAVHERVRRGICVHALAQPAKGELENRPRLAEPAVCLVHVGNLARRGLAGQHGQQRCIHTMDARENAADLKGELRADRRERFGGDVV